MTDIWEPWTPEVGQRVRVRVSQECHTSDLDALEYDGQEATVIDINRIASLDGHFYGIRFIDGTEGNAAAIELEPVE